VILIVGATGLLGTEICGQLRETGRPVRALVRRGAKPAKLDQLKKLGVELAEGDLKDPGSIRRACQGVKAVISTASSTLSRREGDSIRTVDLDGQIGLVDAAQAAGVDHFVFISFRNEGAIETPLTEAKSAVERRLKESGLAFTILQASYFMEVWLSPAVGFDVAAGKVRIYGEGRNKLSWISLVDVARFAVRALDEPQLRNRVVEVGGPEALSPLEVVRAFEAAGSPEIGVEHVPEATLRSQMENATDPLENSFAGLMLQYAAGDPIDMTETRKLLPVKLTSVRDYVSRTLSRIEKQESANA
jgi:uncharacterized protein YbjT (DUF2867 family)